MKTDELVKRLREYTEWARANEWEVPITLADALEAAADTIERLDNFADSQCCRLLEKLQKADAAIPRWISVKDRLPDEKNSVLILCKNGAMFTGYRLNHIQNYDSGWMVHTVLRSTKKINKGRVTHWMPLPSAEELK